MDSRFAIFRQPSFLFYWLGYVLSQLGDVIFMITMSWMIVEVTGSGIIMGTFLMMFGIPRLAVMLIGGVMVDRYDPRKVMIYSDLLRAAVLALILAFSIGGMPELWFFYVMAVIFGLVDAFYWPAAGVIRQRVVAKEHYTQSNSVLIGSMQVAGIIGPLAGAMIFVMGGYHLGLVLNALSFVISAGTLAFVKLQPKESAAASQAGKQKRSFKADFLEGIRYVWKSPVILTMIIVSFFANAGANGVSVGLPFLAEKFGVGAAGLGQMSAGWGIGGLIGAVVISLIAIKNPTPRMTLTAFFVQGIAIFLTIFTLNHWYAAALLVVCGLASTSIQVFSSSVNQTIIPPELMGRVGSVMALISMGSTPPCQALAGWVIDTFGLDVLYFSGGLLELTAAGLAFLVPAIRLYGRKNAGQNTSGNVTV